MPAMNCFPHSILTLVILIMTSLALNAQIRINHTAIFVKDIQKSGHFYQNILGLQRIKDPFNDDAHIWLETSQNTSLHIIKGAAASLIYFKNHHTCYSVKDISTIIKKLEEGQFSFEDVDGNKGKYSTRADGVRQIYLQDPDGYWIEINDAY